MLIQKFLERKKLSNLSVSELPVLAEEDLSLPSWRSKPVEIIFLDQELDQINQKIKRLQGEASGEVFSLSEPKLTTEVKKLPEKRAPTVIEVPEEHEIVNQKLIKVSDLLVRLEQATLETGKIIHELPKHKEIKESLNFKYTQDKTLVQRLQDAVAELQGRLQELESRREKKYLKKETQKKVKEFIEKVSLPSASQEEKLFKVEKELGELKKIKEREAKVITISPIMGHQSFLSQQQQERAHGEIKKIIKEIESKQKTRDKFLLIVENKIASLGKIEEKKVKILAAQPNYPGKSSLEKEIIDRELNKITTMINKTKKGISPKLVKMEFDSPELQQIDQELSRLKKVKEQEAKVITISPIMGHQSFLSEAQRKKVQEEVRKIMREIRPKKKQNERLLKVENELANLESSLEPETERKAMIKPVYIKKGSLEKEVLRRELRKTNRSLSTLKKVFSGKKAKPVKSEELKKIERQLADLKTVNLQEGKVILFHPLVQKKSTPLEEKKILHQELKKIKVLLSGNLLQRKKNNNPAKEEQKKAPSLSGKSEEKSYQELEQVEQTLARIRREREEELAIAQ